MTEEEFTKVKKIVTDPSFLRIDDNSVIGLTASIPYKYSIYVDILSSELRILKNLYAKKDHEYGKKLRYYKEVYKKSIDTKSEYDSYINSDDDYYQLLLDISRQEVYVRFIEETLSNIKNAGFQASNFLKLKQFFAGG